MTRAILALCLLAACDNASVSSVATRDLRSILLDETQYMRLRPGLCVGYFWASDHNGTSATGGPVVFVVPCDLLSEKP